MSDFHQSPPALGNQYEHDRALRSLVRRLLGGALAGVEGELVRLGGRVVGDVAAWGEEAEGAPPRHVPYDAWGRRVDRIVVSEGWRALDRVSAEEGLVACAYERRLGALSRVAQMARLYLFHPASATYSCPLAMTDGAARCLELHAGGDPRLAAAFARLTSRDPDAFWTSGQWMTERSGGSDVSGTATEARPAADGRWTLHGVKWFTSATTAQMALTLARPAGAAAGSAGLSLFQVELRDAGGALRGIRVERLKEKLGTRALPTAELTLDGADAVLVGGEGGGVRRIAALLNVTRVYNACCAAGGMRRAVALAADYARRRRAFGRPLAEQPLHVETLAAMQVEAEGALHLVMRVAQLMGRDECGEATDAERALLRLLVPVAKLYTARQGVAVASEALEAFGGAGYVEDTGLPRLLRDAQVLAIWEGTTNVLSLDVLRALDRAAALPPLLAEVERCLTSATGAALRPAAQRVREAAARLEALARRAAGASRAEAEAGARALAFAIARLTIAALLVEHAAWAAAAEQDPLPSTVARRWCERELVPASLPDETTLHASAALLGFRPA